MTAVVLPSRAKPKVVLVTGASSGIGRATALRLASAGYRVYAGVRHEEDAATLTSQGHAHVHPVLLDVTELESVARVAADLTRAEDGLHALINNAGATFVSPVELVDLEMARQVLLTNLFGPLVTIRDFLPLLREVSGRIVNVGSLGGWVAAPFTAVYNGSKLGLEAFTNSLRVELAPFGIAVILVLPGMVRTPMIARTRLVAERLLDAQSHVARERYARPIRGMLDYVDREVRFAVTPEHVAQIIERAVSARHPRAHYVSDAKTAMLRVMMRVMPARLHDWIIARALKL